MTDPYNIVLKVVDANSNKFSGIKIDWALTLLFSSRGIFIVDLGKTLEVKQKNCYMYLKFKYNI